ncbi:MAG TPA: hypothetical protein VFG69_11860 [Nannocystaceae bacterium]|nr:hypothetical protein [Nannocystaceae bacterium]
MRWLVLVVIAAACTADNPEFDRSGTTGNTSRADDDGVPSTGADTSSNGASDEAGEGGSSGAVAECGPFDEDHHVELKIDDQLQCGPFFAIGVIELVDGDELHLRCNEDTDSSCPPGALAVLKNGWGFPPELVADPKRILQMQFDTAGDCEFEHVEMQVQQEERLKFIALGAPGIFQTITSYEVTAHLVEACDCPAADCCNLPAGRYELRKALVDGPITLAEGQEKVAELDGAAYRFHNFASHVEESCDKVFHWQAVLQ